MLTEPLERADEAADPFAIVCKRAQFLSKFHVRHLPLRTSELGHFEPSDFDGLGSLNRRQVFDDNSSLRQLMRGGVQGGKLLAQKLLLHEDAML